MANERLNKHRVALVAPAKLKHKRDACELLEDLRSWVQCLDGLNHTFGKESNYVTYSILADFAEALDVLARWLAGKPAELHRWDLSELDDGDMACRLEQVAREILEREEERNTGLTHVLTAARMLLDAAAKTRALDAQSQRAEVA